MKNIDKVQDILDRAEKYIEDKNFKPEVKSRLTPEESEESREKMIEVINKISDFEQRKMIKTGFSSLDKYINLSNPQVILLNYCHNWCDMFSGDIANHIALEEKQSITELPMPVLEIVNSRKEYLIKRLLVNQANVNYRKWCLKNEYTDQELKQIGKSTVDLIEVTKRLPTIIEEETLWPRAKRIKQIVYDFANDHERLDISNCLIVLDLFEMNTKQQDKEDKKRTLEIIKYMAKVSKELRCTIIITNWISKKDKSNINLEDVRENYNFDKYIDTYWIMNSSGSVDNYREFDIDVFQQNKLRGTAKIKYDIDKRKFLDME